MPQDYTPNTALIVVDMQADFASPSGALYVRGGEETIPGIRAEIDACRAAGQPVFFTQDWHPADTPHFDKWPVHCVQDDAGAAIVWQLTTGLGSWKVIRKGQSNADGYSGFETGELHAQLADAEISELVIVGLAADFCVKATAMDARQLGYIVAMPMNLTRFVTSNPAEILTACHTLRRSGVVLLEEGENW